MEVITIKKIVLILMMLCFLCGCSNSSNSSIPNSKEYTINDLFGNEIPVPSNAQIKDNTLIITGKNPDKKINEYLKMLSDNGWKQITVMGTKRFYEKTINGKNVTISVLSIQEGGIQEVNIETVVQFRIEGNPNERNKTN